MKHYKIIILSLFLINFFGLTSISNTILLIVVLLLGILGLKKKMEFTLPIICMIFGLILSVFSCYIYRGQDILSTIKALPNLLYILFYFVLAFIKPNLKQLEKSISILVIIFNCIYIIQFILLQKGIIFMKSAELSAEHGINARFRMVASGLTSLGLFFGLNKYFLEKKIKYLTISISSFIVIFLMGFRTMLFFSFVFSLVLIIRVNGFNKKNIQILIIGGTILLILVNISFFTNRLQYTLERQHTENFRNKDYIRLIQLDYFFNIYFNNKLEMLLGSGMPFANTKYDKHHQNLQAKGFFYSDWGLLGLSWLVGLTTITSMIWYSIKACKFKLQSKYYYLGQWFLYLLFSSITTAEFYREGNFLVQAICLYTIELATKQYYLIKNCNLYRYENRNFNISSST